MDRLKRNLDIIIILVIGFALRFTISFTHSYSNDELSAINRLQYDNFSDLIEFGVKTGDMHPAGVQVFMKAWSQIAGVDELGMRFPFVLCGTFSILLLFLIGNKWVNRPTGLISAILLALLYFPIMNSEFARPYSPGLMFSLLAAWFYLKILFDEKKKYKDAIFLGLSVAGAMYTHHFAFMFVGWLGISGLLYLKRNNFKQIILAAILASVLYLAHLSITQYQLGVGGLQWLGKPDANWLFQFISHVFNDSWIVMSVLVIFAVLAIFFKEKINASNKKVLILSAIWFFGIYIVAHLYSQFNTPILKFPVMLFALPFLFILISFGLSRFKYQGVLFSVLMLVIATSTTREKDLFGNMHYELFEEVAEDIVRWNEDYGEENIYTVYNINNPNYMNFYANQWDKNIEFDWDVIEFGDSDSLRKDLKNRKERYCIVGYSARITSPQFLETCKEYYPNILEYKKYNNSAVFLLSKNQPARLTQKKARFAYCSVDKNEDWNFDRTQIKYDSIVKNIYDPIFDTLVGIRVESKGKFIVLENEAEYGPLFEFSLNLIDNPFEKYIKVSVKANIEMAAQLTVFVSATRNGELLTYRDEPYWQGRDIEQLLESGSNGYFVFKIPNFLKDDDVLKIGLWNRNPRGKILVKWILIEVYDNIWN
jgi:Dolichyl-phosphate-mannose-protein mannosyltransferase